MKNELIFGLHAVTSALRNDADHILRVIYDSGRSDKRIDALLQSAKKLGIPLEPVNKGQLDKMTGGARHQSVLAEYQAIKSKTEDDLLDDLSAVEGSWLILVLDGIQDPHNLGACLRTADAVGVHAVVAPRDRAVGITPVVRKVAAGAASTVPFYQVTNLSRTLAKLQKAGVWISGTDDQAEQIYTEPDYTLHTAIVMGAEENGLRRLTKEQCDELIGIPMAGSVSSLNVSVATAVCLYEVVRQRRLAADC